MDSSPPHSFRPGRTQLSGLRPPEACSPIRARGSRAHPGPSLRITLFPPRRRRRRQLALPSTPHQPRRDGISFGRSSARSPSGGVSFIGLLGLRSGLCLHRGMYMPALEHACDPPVFLQPAHPSRPSRRSLHRLKPCTAIAAAVAVAAEPPRHRRRLPSPPRRRRSRRGRRSSRRRRSRRCRRCCRSRRRRHR